MKFGEFTALVPRHIETIFVKVEGEPGSSYINPFGAISFALQDHDISVISTYNGFICLTLKKGAGA